MPTKRIEDLLVVIIVRIGHFIVGGVGAVLLVLGVSIINRQLFRWSTYNPLGEAGRSLEVMHGLNPGSGILIIFAGIMLAGGVLSALFGPYAYSRYNARRNATGTLDEIRRKSAPRRRRQD